MKSKYGSRSQSCTAQFRTGNCGGYKIVVLICGIVLITTLRSENGDVHENVAEKQTSHHFNCFTIIPIRPVTSKKRSLAGAGERGTRSSSDRDGRTYRLAVPVRK